MKSDGSDSSSLLSDRQASKAIRCIDDELQEIVSKALELFKKRDAVILLSEVSAPLSEELEGLRRLITVGNGQAGLGVSTSRAAPYGALAKKIEDILVPGVPLTTKQIVEALKGHGVVIEGRRPDAKVWMAIS